MVVLLQVAQQREDDLAVLQAKNRKTVLMPALLPLQVTKQREEEVDCQCHNIGRCLLRLMILLYQFLICSSVNEGTPLRFKSPEHVTPVTSRFKLWCRMAILVEAIDPQMRSISISQTTNRTVNGPVFLHQYIVVDKLVSPFSNVCGAASWCFTMFSPPKVMVSCLDDSASALSI